MTHFTVQLAYAAYYSHTATVEADNLTDALAKAIEEANQSSSWSSSDYCGNTFVEAVAVGEDVDLWNDERVRPLPIPSRFTEDGEGPQVVVTVEGGLVQHVDIHGGTALVEIHDYDTEGTNEPGEVLRDPDGTPYLRALYSNRIEGADTGPAPGHAS